MSDDEKPVDRRRFFRAALGELLKPLERTAKPLERAIHHIGELEQGPPAPAAPAPSASSTSAMPPMARAPVGSTFARSATFSGRASMQDWLRPPGALPEAAFRSTCSQCGECVQVCPARCIKIEPGGRGDGLPFIDASEMPCVLCDGLLCMPKCPTGALVPTLLADIDMGTAEWHAARCVRTRGEECTTCIDQCPIGSDAIDLFDGKVRVKEEGCVGCGVCQHYCPTTPKSITVTPRTLPPASS